MPLTIPYSHTDFYDLTANVEGALAAFEVFHAYLVAANPALLSDVVARFAAVEGYSHRSVKGMVLSPTSA